MDGASIAVLAGVLTGAVTLIGNIIWTTTKITTKIENRLTKIETKMDMFIKYQKELCDERCSLADERISKMEKVLQK